MTRSEIGNAMVRDVALPAVMALLILSAIVAAILHFSTSQTDELAAEGQNQRVNVAVAQGIIGIANDQEASTYWDDAVVQTRKRPLDLNWIDNNLGIWFHTYYHVDEAYLLDAHDRPVYAMQRGRRVRPDRLRQMAPVLELARDLRRTLRVARLAPVGGEGRTVGASDFAVIGGHPAIVSLKPILSETGDVTQLPGSEYLHVAVRYLDGEFLDRMATTYGIDAPRFSWTEPQALTFPLRRSDGRTVGFIS